MAAFISNGPLPKHKAFFWYAFDASFLGELKKNAAKCAYLKVFSLRFVSEKILNLPARAR